MQDDVMNDVWNTFTPTAARKHSPNRVNRLPMQTIDIHSHVGVPAAARETERLFGWVHYSATHFASAVTTALNQQQELDRASRMTQYDDRLRDLDAAGIDIQLVMPAPPQCYYTVPLEIGVRASRMVNDGLAEYVARRPDRFRAFGTVPLQNGPAAAEELDYVVRVLGFKGVQILTNVAGRDLSDPDLEVFWERAERIGAVVFLHPNGFTEGQRLSRFYFNNLIGNPLDTTVALHYLIFDGVMEQHPDLKILAAHGGGYATSYAGRMDHAWGARSDTRAYLPQAPTTYLKRIYFDSVVFTPEQLEALVRFVGPDHVLMGSDYPYDMADSEPVSHITSSALSSTDIAAICGGNAKRLLAL
jgi:aminocarboxymuconate-semialdehyde decarboxylase